MTGVIAILTPVIGLTLLPYVCMLAFFCQGNRGRMVIGKLALILEDHLMNRARAFSITYLSYRARKLETSLGQVLKMMFVLGSGEMGIPE
ncbi:hypothetical protein LIER_13830 [Lithospermum erythrorhizon]|uniref:ABC transmembrane type-1 domain-containing protein n=1 Tax=Lithospermum erythrorhizon TaxID=34254 RepID=A0AAV3PWT9_LITER